ncbi:hypothetical protein L195_g022954 [Trifolium pratense]|uniref:Uncharacterized protein n=1 Tax=Trifolium pratense TaxID=57577 RepID=A0A2K3N9G5_TRIPR|nr:hypothetical protein L195_g022954 [Trifolium pratense]
MRRSLSRPARREVPSPVSASIGRSRDLTNQIGFVINPFYWIAAFSFIFTYLAGTAVYSVVVSSINAEPGAPFFRISVSTKGRSPNWKRSLGSAIPGCFYRLLVI